MVTVEITYTINKTKKLNLTTRQYCEYHGNRTELKKQLAKENRVYEEDIDFTEDMKIIDGKLNYDNLDEQGETDDE